MEKQRKNSKNLKEYPEFKTELAKIAKLTRAKIAKDSFTKNIEPKFLRDAVRDYPLRDGKCLRPALLIWTCGLLGGNPKKAELAAAAVEIFHNWTLVHDDIIDNDDFRKNLPSTHKLIANFAKNKYALPDVEAETFGRNNAILAGDIQHAWAIDLIARTAICENRRIDIIRKLCSCGGKELICGECLDVEISFKKWKETDYQDLLKIARLKTAKLLEFCVFAAAKIAGEENTVSEAEIRALTSFANFAGTAFQIKDDLIGIFADKTGKPPLSDLSEGKPSSAILIALKNSKHKDKTFLLSLTGKKHFSISLINKVRAIIRDSGAEKICLANAERLTDKAINILLKFRDCDFRKLLLDWTHYVVRRDK